MDPTVKSRKSSKRSRAGCRTCRARHIKCDERPGACNNCISTARECDGYDIARLPGKKKSSKASLAGIGMQLDWQTTMDERRCFSYFMHCSVLDLTTFFSAPLWQKQALQMSTGDRAVYHAANMLGALHEDSNYNKMRVSGENLCISRHRVALEQGSRAFAHLHRRRASQDPQFREVVLLCCLLFVLGDLMLGRYQNAFVHLRSGLEVLRETQQKQSLDRVLVETFARLDAQSSHFGPGRPFLFAETDEVSKWPHLNSPRTFTSLYDVHRTISEHMSTTVPFFAKCWKLSKEQKEAEFDELSRLQKLFLSRGRDIERRFNIWYAVYQQKATYQEKYALELLRLQCPGAGISLQSCLCDGPAPEDLMPEFERTMEMYDAFVAKFPERPTIMLNQGVIVSLWCVASKGPRWAIRLRAINALLSWPHCEGFANSNVAASVALESLKADMQKSGHVEMAVLSGEGQEELAKFWAQTVKAVPQMQNWSPVRSTKVLQEK